jgi:hypothetical protein
MPTFDRKRRRALTLLAGSPGGATETILLAHGFTAKLIAELVDAGLATAARQRVGAFGREITVTRIRISAWRQWCSHRRRRDQLVEVTRAKQLGERTASRHQLPRRHHS